MPSLLRCALSILLLVSAPACSRERDAQAAFDHAFQAFERGEMATAAKEADEGYRRFHGIGAQWAWKFVILRGRILCWRGINDRALELLSSEPSPPRTGDLAVQRLRLEGVASAYLHRFSMAEEKLDEAERLCSNSDYPSCGDIVRARGIMAMQRAQYPVAEHLFERALALAHVHDDIFLEATAYLNLSYAADEQTHFDAAMDAAQRSLRIALPNQFADIAQAALGNIGWAYYKLGDVEKAHQTFSEARKQAAKLGDSGDEIQWVTDDAYTYLDRSQLSDAEQSFQQSFKLAEQINSREDIINSLIALAFVSEQSGKLDDAQRYADEALAMARADSNGRDVVYPLLVEGRVAVHRNDAATAEDNFHQVEQSPDTPVFLKWEAERSLARLYEDEKKLDMADGEYRMALSTFEAERCGLHERVDSRLPFLSNAARIYEDYIHFLVARDKTDEALRVADYDRASTLAEGLGRPCNAKFEPHPLHAPEIARRAGGTILFYALGQQHSYLWAITPGTVQLFPLSSNQAEIDAAVTRYRNKLEGPPGILAAANDGGVLYQMLVAPAEELLKQEARRKNTNVFIIPDGGLNSLNFETLLPQPHHYWIEDVTIADAPSLRLLPGSSQAATKLAGKLLLIGNPVAPSATPGEEFPELPNAAAQMGSVQKYFPGERKEILAREQASPAAYLSSHPEQFSYIHFVAHGTASRLNPLDSAIILSREPASQKPAAEDSFKLYARDVIAGHPLRAELVTISACYSIGKRTYSGEGLVGLSWAFLRAGAHNVIAALWDVSDASTPQLIDVFYGELQKGKSPSAALRTAKLSLLHEGKFGSPFYWAPFQLYTGS